MQVENLELSKITGYVAIIPAAGKGNRFGEPLAKQYQPIKGKALLDYTLDIFIQSAACEKIVLIVSAQDENYQQLINIINHKIIVIEGGEQRQDSVHNGLKYLFDNGLPDTTPLLIHDAVRPCLADSDLNALLECFSEKQKPCFLAANIADSVKKVDSNLLVLDNLNRDQLVAAQTPQMAHFIDINKAFIEADEVKLVATDDVALLCKMGLKVEAVISKQANFKVTRKIDLQLAELVLVQQGRC
ncbi:MAG: 2-C-methyl-D-erythritol 4-phosphate cytidylyltransferase [Enterobacterales bacterium]|nr:2-C-methyl-D-erythritol 4-phosphate cytidylyltransferase [Enterobacterales bacterium]